MLQQMSDGIYEQNQDYYNGNMTLTGGVVQQTTSCYPYYQQPYITWYNYPVYITTDKTKKAIDILKALQAEKLLECKSVNKFIELVEKISNLL